MVLLRCAAIATFIVYCLWWAYWLAHGQLPPALFRAVTGLPAPTTGMTRALLALREGQWRSSLAFNAMAIPIACLTGVTLACACVQAVRGRRIALPRGIVWTWVLLLAVAWVLKLVSARQYW